MDTEHPRAHVALMPISRRPLAFSPDEAALARSRSRLGANATALATILEEPSPSPTDSSANTMLTDSTWSPVEEGFCIPGFVLNTNNGNSTFSFSSVSNEY